MAAPLRVVVTGVGGRMGAAVLAALRSTPDLVLSGATERPGSPLIGQRIEAVSVSSSLRETSGDVVIDFTSPASTAEHARLCAERAIPVVIGTTGLSADQRREIGVLAGRIPIVLAPNMCVGVNVLFRIAADVAQALGDYDVEIVEAHHRHKKDAPSGTALRLAEVIAGARGLDPSRSFVKSRDGQIGERPADVIGIQSVRGGDTAGEHTAFFFGAGERLELTHRASSRESFAHGALRAARWIVRQPPGLYDMMDVLGFARRSAP